jgi:hypothetical protein
MDSATRMSAMSRTMPAKGRKGTVATRKRR